MVQIFQGDCVEKMKGLADDSVDSIVTDPPYGISFMGQNWDHQVPGVEVWREALRVLKPGGHLLAFAGTRTQHRMASAIEDAGFEIRDMLAWTYGSGFPKSLDVSKAIDKAAGAKREVIGVAKGRDTTKVRIGMPLQDGTLTRVYDITAAHTEEARRWEGWGTALKPALEPITFARKPFKVPVAANVLEYGTGAINIDGCRVETDESRWPANLLHDGSDEATAPFGEASRFFYCGKASKRDRDEGLEDFELQPAGGMKGRNDGSMGAVSMSRNVHPTVKPTALMRYLCRLVTPPGGVVLDPFMGSGSTGKAAVLEGFSFIGVDLEAQYVDIARARIDAAVASLYDFLA